MTLMGVVHNYQGLLAARWFLGLAEAGYELLTGSLAQEHDTDRIQLVPRSQLLPIMLVQA